MIYCDINLKINQKFKIRFGEHLDHLTIPNHNCMLWLRLRKVELVRTGESGTGHAALLGPGNTWGNVLRVLPIQRSGPC